MFQLVEHISLYAYYRDWETGDSGGYLQGRIAAVNAANTIEVYIGSGGIVKNIGSGGIVKKIS